MTQHNGTLSYLAGTLIILFFWIVIGPFIVSMVDIESAKPNVNFAIQLIPAVTGWIGLFITMKWCHKKTIVSLASSKTSMDYKKLILGFSVFLLLIGLLHVFYLKDITINASFNMVAFFGLMLTFWTMMLLQVLLEEFLFRGYLYHGVLSQTRSRFLATLLPTILFGLMHLGGPSTEQFGSHILFSYIWMGFIFGVVRSLDLSLELSIGGHLANNFFLCALVQPNWQGLHLSSFYTNQVNISASELILFQFILGGLFLIVLYSIYRWPFTDFLYFKKN